MIKLFSLDQIKSKINISNIIKLQEDGFVAASKGHANIPMPGYLKYNNPMSSYHIKYGHLENDDFWIIKIAGGPHHLQLNGMMLAMNTKTGTPEYILQDEGYEVFVADSGQQSPRVYRVRIGPFATEKQALQVRKRIESAKIGTPIVITRSIRAKGR